MILLKKMRRELPCNCCHLCDISDVFVEWANSYAKTRFFWIFQFMMVLRWIGYAMLSCVPKIMWHQRFHESRETTTKGQNWAGIGPLSPTSPPAWRPIFWPAFFVIARRHGHVFRMALHNEGDWRMETWQRARRASCHVSIRQSSSCVMPFWTHAKWLLAFISYFPMWIKAKYTFIKTVYSPRFYGGPYLQAKHADVCSGVLFWTACTRRPH